MNSKKYGFNSSPSEAHDVFDQGLELEIKNISNDEVPVKIFIREEVIYDISSYSKSDTSRELGGVLLGRHEEGDEKYKVIIEETVIAKHTEANISKVTFTHETWDDIHHEMEEKYPNLKIVGWFHTHPGFGIFLSEDDYFIHSNFFTKPWLVAYVVDPIRKQEGFFGWSNGNIVRIPDRHINDIMKKKESEKQHTYNSRHIKTKGFQSKVWQKIFRKVFIIILALSLMANVYFLFAGDNNFKLESNHGYIVDILIIWLDALSHYKPAL